MPTWKIIVSGIVQGVGFRYSVMNFAQSQHLTGSVKNNPDSTVTIILQAPRTKVDQFLNELPHHLSPFAKISKIELNPMEKVEKMHDFHVSY